MEPGTNRKSVIVTDDAPSALGSYSQGIINADKSRLYTSGQVGLDPTTLELVDGVEAQIRQTFANIAGICAAAGASLEHISKLTVYLVSRDDWSMVNQVMAELFTKPFPARTAVGVVWLPLGALVEVEAVVDLSGTGK
ncbi:RutC family protein in vnfA 5'region [Pseudomonas reidholzensis]|uniref:RutC family protein in vnfA 5'region n=1 Tax=Pseudomonas reidholzensis TaxID=1785162 RepID=A0A383RU57_9PSED|nr:Rid family detoxifying hydrolase [Pseudomonas reidholzensis]SYX90580.1 RutC family protein in vnfA 5'region [Pseudomonas reidholzensis]